MADYIFNIPGAGGSVQIARYPKDSCSERIASLSISESWDDVTIELNEEDETYGYMVLTVPANPSPTEGRRKDVTISFYFDDVATTVSATLCQANNGSGPSLNCCSSYSFGEILNIIPSTGVTETPLPIINVTSSNERCDFTNVTITSSTITQLHVDSDGIVYVDKCSAVGQEEVKEHLITLVYDDTACNSVKHEIPQDGDTSRCDCTSINSWVVPLRRTFSNSVHTNQLIASAYTHYCGVVSATTQSDMLYGGNVTCDYTHGERGSVAYIYASVEPNTGGEQRTCGIKLLFKRAGSSEFGECVDKNITLIQGDGYASCSKITYPNNPRMTVSFDTRYDYWTFKVPSGTKSYYALKYEIISGDFITSITDGSYNNDRRNLTLYFGANSSSEDREAVVRCTPYYDVTWIGENKWVGGIACDPIDLTLVQLAGAGQPCECSNAGLELQEQPKVITETTAGHVYAHVYYSCNGTRDKLPSGWKLKVKSFEPTSFIYQVDGPSWNNGYYYFTVRYEANPEGVAREGNIVIALDTPDGECTTITQNVKNDEVVCTDCQNALSGLNLNSSKFKPAGSTSDRITSSDGACFRGLIVEQCDSEGNAATYDWFRVASISKPASTYVTVSPNETADSRTGYLKYIPTDNEGNPLFNNCYKIQTLSQTAFAEPTCSNLNSDGSTRVGSTGYTSDSNKITAGTENSRVAKIRVSSSVIDIRSLELDLSTQQGAYLSNLQYTKGERQYDYSTIGGDNTSYIEFEITCNTHDDGSMPEIGIAPTIDYALKINGTRCQESKLVGYITVNLAKPQ